MATQSTSSLTPNADLQTNKKSVNGKVILKVKSGPGVIIGDTERDIQNGQVSFSGIEFDQEGDYIISVTSTSPDVESTEFKVKVTPQIINLEQKPSDKTDSSQVSGSRSIIAQIDKPTLDLPPMRFDKTDGENENTLVAGQIGMTPFINYMGFTINDRDISSLKLGHDGIIPIIQFTFKDTNNIIKSVGFPQDDTKFEFFLNSRSENLKSIHLKFKIEEFTNLKNGKYSIYGTIDISDLYRIKYQTYNGTSFEVLRQISNELKLGFNSNITNTDDKMPWRNVGDKQYTFINDVIKHSYISDKSYMIGFIDYYYCFNYVDVEKESQRDNSKDVCINTAFLDNGKTSDDQKLVKLQLTTEKGSNTSNCYINEKSFENNSTSLSLEKGYMTKTKYYDKTKKMFLIFDIDSTTSDESKSMILKGSNGDKEAFDNNITTTYAGKIDTDNVHKNYNYAVTQNKINIDNLNKIIMTVDLPNPNYGLYLYQKVNAIVVNQEPPSETNKETVQWRKSGDYIISELNYIWNGKSLSQELKLIRKELGKNPEEIKQGPPPSAPKDVKDPKQENPTPPNDLTPAIVTSPNTKYAIGEIYTVENSNGNRFILTITSLLENGNDVSATVKQIESTDKSITTPVTPISGEFLFNVAKDGFFVGNTNIGELSIIGNGEIYENTSNTEVEPDQLDPEYTEDVYQGVEEFDPQVSSVSQLGELQMIKDADASRDTSEADKIFKSTGQIISGKLNTKPSKLVKFGVVGKNMTDKDLLKIMVTYIEGGYYYPAHAYSQFSSSSRSLYGNSGETLWGIDRHAGDTESTQLGRNFWSSVDKISGYGDSTGVNGYSRKTNTKSWDSSSYKTKSGAWKYNYMPSKKDQGYDTMYNSFVEYGVSHLNDWLNKYFQGHPVKSLILIDTRMKFMWYRAAWNGPGYFNWYANGKKGVAPNGLKWAYDNYSKNPDDLILWDLNNRLLQHNSLITEDVQKIATLVGIKG